MHVNIFWYIEKREKIALLGLTKKCDLNELSLGLSKLALVFEEHGVLAVDLLRLLVGGQSRQFERKIELIVVAGIVNACQFKIKINFIASFK